MKESNDLFDLLDFFGLFDFCSYRRGDSGRYKAPEKENVLLVMAVAGSWVWVLFIGVSTATCGLLLPGQAVLGYGFCILLVAPYIGFITLIRGG